MKIDPKANDTAIFEILQRNNTISSLEKCFAKLKVDKSPTELLENQLKNLNLEDDKGKLIERGPVTTKDTKEPKNKPYQKVTENVNIRHTSGGTFIWTKGITQQNYNNFNNSFASNYSEQNSAENYIYPVCQCDACKLQVANSPEYIDWLEQVYNSIQPPKQALKEAELTVTNISYAAPTEPINENTLNNFEVETEFVKPHVRRISHDSGFQSDIPSPSSDSVLSPKPSVTVQPSKTETVAPNYRKILPKPTEVQKKEETITFSRVTPKNKSSQTKQKSKEDQKEKSLREEFKSTLDQDIKQLKWVELVLTKSNDELFGTCCNGQTILHKLLKSDEKYIAESFYAIVEKMKKNPAECSHIMAAESSIRDAIRQNKHPQLWLDYFCEAVQIIQQNVK